MGPEPPSKYGKLNECDWVRAQEPKSQWRPHSAWMPSAGLYRAPAVHACCECRPLACGFWSFSPSDSDHRPPLLHVATHLGCQIWRQKFAR